MAMTYPSPAEKAQAGEPPRGAISPRSTARIRIEHDLRVPMRDGVHLALDVLLPDAPGPLPVVLVRTPYDKTLSRQAPFFRRLAERGYAVAFNDCRGRFNSDGSFEPYFNESHDGHDTVEWIAAQPWCDGNVGMIGGSYAGQTQWFAASQRPPHLKAIVPMCSPPGSLWRNEPLLNGCFMLGVAEWLVLMGRRSWQVAPDFSAVLAEQQPYFDALPVSEMPEVAGVRSAWWDEMMDHPRYDDYWRRGEYSGHETIDVAALNVTGWWDMNFPGAPLNFEAMKRSPSARRQKLIIGPWPHAINTSRALNGVDFGENAVIALDDYVTRFFDRWLKGVGNHIEGEKPVYVFVTGVNEWWAEDDWPLPGTEVVPFYFDSMGSANSLRGDGRLLAAPPENEAFDCYTYDPRAPVSTLWRVQDGPVDDRLASLSDDLLCYTSEPLEEPLDVVGWVSCRLFASSSAVDTDWHARLMDVHPDGSARFLCRGALRARFRNSLEMPELLEPDVPTLFEFTMDACGVRFLPGHRIRVQISSAGFTRYDRNTNTGANNFFHDAETVKAQQKVFHGGERLSCVLLPVVRRSA